MDKKMKKEDLEKFLIWLMTKGWIPKMIANSFAGTNFCMVPFNHLYNLSYDREASAWPYSFVNVSKKLYKMNFNTLDEVVDAVFEADEIWHGSEKIVNRCSGKREEMLIRWQLDGSGQK